MNTGKSQGLNEIWLIRHGETEWSLSGQHTGITDIPLTDHGQQQAKALRPKLASIDFSHVFVSPLGRAQTTCQLAGLGDRAVTEKRLLEWNYGVYEGRKTADIRQTIPHWNVWDFPIPEGEDKQAVEQRAQSLIDDLLKFDGRVALFAHAHILRVLSGCWLEQGAAFGRHLVLDPASISILGFDRETRALLRLNNSAD